MLLLPVQAAAGRCGVGQARGQGPHGDCLEVVSEAPILLCQIGPVGVYENKGPLVNTPK